jgi:FtsZ-interacting cell division protein ZipA
MSDLQLALIAVGAAAVAGVWGYNKWQERQHRKLAERIFKGGQPDVLLPEAGKTEVAAVPAAGKVRIEPGERQEPGIGDMPPVIDAPAEHAEQVHAEAGGPPPLPAEYADEIADCVVRVDFSEPLPAPGLWATQARWAGHIAKPLSWLGFDEAMGSWRQLSAHDAGRYLTVCAAVQLADRRGAITDSEVSAFLDGLRELASQCAGIVTLPKHDDLLMNARALDEFCAGVDLQLGVNIVATGDPFPGTKLRGLAEAAGLKLQDDGIFHAHDESGGTRFVLSNIGPELFEAEAMKSLATQGVTLTLDVPRVVGGPVVFDTMIAAAEQLARGLGGVLVDGHGQPLTAEAIAGIREKVGQLQWTMAQQGIDAGGNRALRLFS